VAGKPSETFLELARAWLEVGVTALEAAHKLKESRNWRGVANRAYYAAYSFSTSLLCLEQMDFPLDEEGNRRDGPAHKPLPDLVGVHLKTRLRNLTTDLRVAISQLYTTRIVADYKPRSAVTESDSTKALIQATRARHIAEKELGSYR
jgi:hypothetical protein